MSTTTPPATTTATPSSPRGVVQEQVVKPLQVEMSREIALIKRLGSWALTALFVLLILAFLLGIAVGRSSAVL